EHPLIDALLTQIRSVDTGCNTFRSNLHTISRLMAFEITRDLPSREIEITTPLATARGSELIRSVVMIPILRAGTGMLNGIIDIIPDAKVGHIGMARDEATCLPMTYYCKLPEGINEADVLLIDPMLATGRSAAAAAAIVKDNGGVNIRFVCLVACPEGIEHFCGQHPDIPVYTAAIDDGLDENSYIVPGLGDAGDRYFDTE
ncbi:MAG: uracil phosphoribosyltransferase, partial [Verrucomicrobiaceae bacterium]|nr:uracil phosphoribosyltransferase [Verrucomicrobiaceae bacterium]